MGQFTISQKADELVREIKMRERVYPRLVGNGKLKQIDADRNIAIMREIADDYLKQLPTSPLAAPADLFGEDKL
jgi:hypothetical protein